jgi:hypothetical protein
MLEVTRSLASLDTIPHTNIANPHTTIGLIWCMAKFYARMLVDARLLLYADNSFASSRFASTACKGIAPELLARRWNFSGPKESWITRHIRTWRFVHVAWSSDTEKSWPWQDWIWTYIAGNALACSAPTVPAKPRSFYPHGLAVSALLPLVGLEGLRGSSGSRSKTVHQPNCQSL